jgi:hypothetical protein
MFSEQDVDRELRAALSISPSPDFEARVLQRVEADRRSRSRAQYSVLAAAAALVIAAGLFSVLRRPPVAVAPGAAPQIVEHTAPASGPTPAAPIRRIEAGKGNAQMGQAEMPRTASATPRAGTVRVAQTTVATAARTPGPEAIVPLNQMEAVRRLVRAVNEGRVEMPAEPAEGPMAPPAELGVAVVGVAPVVVEPIPLSPVVGGGNFR